VIIIGNAITWWKSEGDDHSVRVATEARDEEFIADLAKEQAGAGADYLTVFPYDRADECENLLWAVDVVQSTVDTPLCVNNKGRDTLIKVMERAKTAGMIDCSYDTTKACKDVFPLLEGNDWKVIVRPQAEDGKRPEAAAAAAEGSFFLLREAETYGIGPERLFINPLAVDISSEPEAALMFMEAIRLIREKYPAVHIVAPIEHVAHDSQYRGSVKGALRQAFLALAASAGMDAAIFDPLDLNLRRAVYAGEALLGKDPRGRAFSEAYRKRRLETVKCPQCGRAQANEKRVCEFCGGDMRPEFNRLDALKNEIINEGLCPGCAYRHKTSRGKRIQKENHKNFRGEGEYCRSCGFPITGFLECIEKTCEEGCDKETKYTDDCFQCWRNPTRRMHIFWFFGLGPGGTGDTGGFSPDGLKGPVTWPTSRPWTPPLSSLSPMGFHMPFVPQQQGMPPAPPIQSIPPVPLVPPAAASAQPGWLCSCGNSEGNTGKFCFECARPRPANAAKAG